MNRIKQLGFTLSEILLVAIILFGGIGWIWNVVKIAQSDFVLTGMFVLRLIGVFVAPLGAIIGYF